MANQRQRNPKDSHRQRHGEGQYTQRTQRTDRLFQRIRELGLDKRGETEKDLEWVLTDPSDISIIQLLEERVAEEEQQLALHPDPFRANACWNPDRLSGPIALGDLLQTGWRYGFPLEQIAQHLFICGRTQGGKTNFIRALLSQVKRSFPEVNILALETKQQYTDVAKEFGFKILCAGDLRINLLRPPPGVPAHVWLSHLTQIMVDYLDILVATSGFIISQGLGLLRKAGFIDDPTKPCPHLRDLVQHILSTKFPGNSSYARHQETSVSRLKILLDTVPKVFECSEGLPVEALLNDDYLILLDDLPHLSIQHFVKVYLASATFLYRMIVDGEQDHLRNIIVLDEASSLFRRRDELQSKASFLPNIASQAAAFGMGIVAASQKIEDVSPMYLANAGTKASLGGFERNDDVRALLASRPFTKDQEDAVKAIRQPGRAIISDIRHSHFFECQIDLPDLPPRMTRDEVRAASKATAIALGLTHPPAAECAEDDVVDGQKVDEKTTPHTQEKPQTQATTEEDPDVLILRDISESPFETYKSRGERLEMSGGVLKTIITRLEAQGKIKIYPVHDRPGRPRDLYEVTEDGYGVLDMERPTMKGKGGYLHQFYQARASEYLQAQGYRVKIEGRADAKEVDIVAVKEPEGETLAVEIELHAKTSTHFLENARMDLKAARIDRVLFLVPTKPEIETIERAIGGDLELSTKRADIEVDYIRNYMDLKS